MKGQSMRNGSWIILRTSGRHTLRLASSLKDDGYEVWTPTEVKKIRIPRMNVRRSVTLPLLPSYVFAKAAHMIDLLQLSDRQFKAHADFSVMRMSDSIPLIGDEQLQSLRQLEARRTPLAKAQHKFDAGVEVRVKVEGGSFAGMAGVIRKSDHGHSLVCFDGRLSVKIPTCLLQENNLQMERSVMVARKAA